MIPRLIKTSILSALQQDRKILVVYGARQVGKSTLVQSIIEELGIKTARANGDEIIYHEVFTSRNLQLMKEFIDDAPLLYIDEAQVIKNIGINLKILYDSIPSLKVIITGSSSLDLASDIKEPLTGRTQSYVLYPIMVGELRKIKSIFAIKQEIGQYLVYGMYPEILTTMSISQKIKRLKELASSYLYKDILMLSNIRNSDKIYKLLQLLAYQIGQPVSIHELANTLSLSSETVNHYIDLLEQSFVVFRLSGYSNNPRKEISKMNKIYFYDLGIRNTIIDNFLPFEQRMDKGQLFENFFIVERIKKNSVEDDYSKYYFWRTYAGAEIDFIEAKDDRLIGYEVKAGKKVGKAPKSWQENYKNSSFISVNFNNFLDYLITE